MGEPTASSDVWHGANPLDPAFRDDPHPALARLRSEAPVFRTPFGIWWLTRHADCVRLLRDVPCGVRTTDGRLPGVDESLPGHNRLFMLEQDPPDHTRLRRLVSRAFTPRAIERLRPRVAEVVDAHLDRVADAGRMDVIADLALPVPSTLICEMLGVPAADRERFTVWTAQATHLLAEAIAPPEVVERATGAAVELAAYFGALIEERRRHRTDDLLSALIAAEEDGDRLSPEELLSQAIGLLIAGFETTIGLIGNGVRALIRQPRALARLRERPDLVGQAVEECLRFEGPILLTSRILHADAAFGDQVIPRDSEVFAMLAAANRDPEVFAEPDRLDIERPNLREHLGFGGGAHFCLGAHLARIEAGLAIGGLVRRFDDLALEEERVEWGPSLFRVPARLPVSFRAA